MSGKEERGAIARAFRDCLAGRADAAQARALALSIEHECYRRAIHLAEHSTTPIRRSWDCERFLKLYGTHCGARISLILPGSPFQDEILQKLVGGELTALEFATREVNQLCPEARALERAIIEHRSSQTVKLKISTLFHCPHCGAQQCTYREVQIRSGDEARNIFCVCQKCMREFNG